MVKFSFFTVRSKCCKKSKFVVLFLFFFCLLDLKFSNSIYTAFTFFFSVCFYAVHSDYCCYPRLMFFLLLLNVLYSLCVCVPFLILFSSCFVSQLDLDLVLSQKMPAPTIPNSQQIAKKDSQEKEIPFSHSHFPSFSHLEASERAQEERVCRDAPHLRDDRRTDPEIANESKREPDEILTRYTFA